MKNSDLVQRVYDSALNPQNYPEILQELSHTVGAYGAMVFDCTQTDVGRRVGVQYLSAVYDSDVVGHYVEKFNTDELADQDRLADLSTPGNEINLVQASKIYSDTYQPRPNVAQMRKLSIVERYGCLLSKEAWSTDRFAFQFREGLLPSAEEIAQTEQILAHLAKSFSMSRVFTNANVVRQGMLKFLNGLGIGVAIVDDRAQLMFSNTEFERILSESSLIAQTAAGALDFSKTSPGQDLHLLIRDRSAHGKHGARPRREARFLPSDDGTGSGLFVEICPLSAHPELDNFAPGARLVTVLDDRQAHAVDASVIATYFPLSQAELSIVELLVAGHSNVEIAEIRGRSIETVKSQMRSILTKTAARSRTELIKVAISLGSWRR